MHHRQDQYEVALDCIKDCVRKNVRETTTNIFIDYSPARRSFTNSFDCIFYRGNKLDRDRLLSFGIPVRCLAVFFQCCRVKCILHPRMESRTSRRASSPGTASTLPDRISSLRRLASVSHTCSIRPRSSPSRL